MQTVAIEGRAFVLSANQCVRKKSLPHWIAGGKSSSIDESGEGEESTYKPARRLRRSSTITKTEDNHEITWPLPESSKILESTFLDEIKHSSSIVSDDGLENNDLEASFPELTRQKSMTTKIEHNHEITWPSPEAKQKSQNSEAPEYSTKITTPSPLRFSTVPVVNDEPEKVEEGFKNTNFPSIVPKSSSSSIPSKDHYIALPAGASSSLVSEHAIPPNPQGKPPSNSELDPSEDEFICRGGSCIISPTGAVIAGPLWEVEDGGLLYATVDFDDCVRGKLDMDVLGSYGRGDVFELKVKDLDLSPPP